MSEAFHFKGFAIEYDVLAPRLTIDGQPIQIIQTPEGFGSEAVPGSYTGTLLQLAELVIRHSAQFDHREQVRAAHLDILSNGVEHWNRWRLEHSEIRPILYDAPLQNSHLSKVNFSNANLIGAQLQHAELIGVNLHEANLLAANLHDAKLMGANFCRTDLYKTDLSEADLTGANLQGTQLAMTNFKGAKLIGCTVYGMSAWDLQLDKDTVQDGLRIRYGYPVEGNPSGGSAEGHITVDDLQVAQFVYLLLNNKSIRRVIDTIGQKAVLILGRFTPERKAVLDAIRRKLRELDFVPMMFDFERPSQRDFTETIKTLAGLSRFIIADITNPRSSPLELQATMPDYMIPFVPIIQEDEKPFPMFKDLKQKYPWVLDLLGYDTTENLLLAFKKGVVERAEKRSHELLLKKNEDLRIRHVSEFL
jgi:uncharacterized protein YjbI with pentapeptide repeats